MFPPLNLAAGVFASAAFLLGDIRCPDGCRLDLQNWDGSMSVQSRKVSMRRPAVARDTFFDAAKPYAAAVFIVVVLLSIWIEFAAT